MALLAHDFWTVDHGHVSSNLIGDGPSNHRLPSARRTVEKYSAGRWDP